MTETMSTHSEPPAGPGEADLSTLWRLIEIWHAVVYFAPERPARYSALGLRGGWMGYFATRSAPLGQVPPGVVTACFYNFHPRMINRALPDAWLYTTPQEALRAREQVFDDAVQRMLGAALDDPGLTRAADLAVAAARACPLPGRPLAAAYAALPVPDEPHLKLFWASGVLREFRGDGHNIALTMAGVDGCEAHVIMIALGLVPADQRIYRGWSDNDWNAATQRLAARGWVHPDGSITEAGAAARAEIEQATDRLAAAPWDLTGHAVAAELTELLTPFAARIVTAGGLPYPNGIGVPPVPELSAR